MAPALGAFGSDSNADFQRAAKTARKRVRICPDHDAPSRIRTREADRNIALLGAATLLSVAAAGIVALLDPVSAPASAMSRPVTNRAPADDQIPIRIVGTPFVPNTNPGQR